MRRGDQQPRALLFDGSPLLASGVFVDAAGVPHTGRDAQRLAGSEPERFDPHPKRRIDEGRVLLGSHEVPVEQLLAAGLRRVAVEARTAGVDPTGATVLTCPADWGQPRRAVLLAAARQAGLGQVRLLDEPIAAATYCMQVLGQQVPPFGCLGVFDFGGGTLDVAVVRREPAGLRVLATGGLDDLGGLDVDSALVAHLGQLVGVRDPRLWERLREPRGLAEQRDRQAFWAEVRSAKEMLSRTAAAPLHVPGREEPMHLTREEVERIAGPLVARAVDETRRVLQRADVEPAALAGLLLVGGSSRMPLVASRLHARLGVAPAVPEQPELPVAYGALLAGMSGLAAGPVEGPVGGTSTFPVSGVGPVSAVPVSGGSVFPVSSVLGAEPVSGVPVSGSGFRPVSAGGPVPGSPVAGPGSPAGPAAPLTGAAAGPAGGVGAASPWAGIGASGQPPAALPVSGVKRRRRPVVRVVAAAVSVAVLVGCVAGVVRGGSWLVDGFSDMVQGAGGSPSGGGLGPFGGGRSGGDLVQVTERPASGAGEVAAAAVNGHVVSAVVGLGSTEVVSLPVAGGEPRWTTTLEVEPTEVRLTPVGELIVVDAPDSATDGGDWIRSVLQESDGKLVWRGKWDRDRTDVVFLGGDVVVEIRDGIYDNAVVRVDLRTGKEKWRRAGPDDLLVIDSHRVEAMRQWTGPEAAAGPGVLPVASGTFVETITAGDVVVELDNVRGRGYLLDANTGKPRGSGSLPIVEDFWTAYDGFVVGQLNDDASPGRSVVAGFSVPGFKQEWSMPLAAGTTVDKVKPCGQHLVCVAVDARANDGDKTMALDVRTGLEKWSVGVEWSTEEDWFVTEGGLLFGEGLFGSLREAQVLDADGKPVREIEEGAAVRATAGGRMVLTDAAVQGGSDLQWFVWVEEVGAAKGTKGVPVGASIPDVVALAGDGVAVVTDDRRTLVLRSGELG
ncbi:Hsp70 family protein [Polymorphospora rubra]|uniref:Hsp70 family protein n=1 Tax=Polymorphospora rubra TaxID=338584 RepID=UPI0033EE1AA7